MFTKDKEPKTVPVSRNGAKPEEEAMREKALRQKAESAEVAGRHKNEGQKDHKGAR